MKTIPISCFLLFFLFSCENFIKQESPPIIAPQLADSLQSVVMAYSQDVNNLPNDYFSDFGFRDWYRWPLVYPFSLNSVDSRDRGFLQDERNGKDNDAEQIQMERINAFSFNKQIFIAETEGQGSQKYLLFNFQNSEIKHYSTFDELTIEASKYGDLLSDSLITLEYYSHIF